MSDTPGSLRSQAAMFERVAVDARRLAADLDRRYVGLEGRLSAVLALHTVATWDSRAATVSRDRLQNAGTASLGRARDTLADVIAALRAHGDDLAADAAGLRRRAAALVTAMN